MLKRFRAFVQQMMGRTNAAPGSASEEEEEYAFMPLPKRKWMVPGEEGRQEKYQTLLGGSSERETRRYACDVLPNQAFTLVTYNILADSYISPEQVSCAVFVANRAQSPHLLLACFLR